MLRPRPGRPAGIYVHIPFCRRLCPYCDFAVSVRQEIPHRAYADAVIDELRARRGEVAGRRAETVYFGGGTPSLLEPSELARIRATIDAIVDDPHTIVENTLEANPLDVTDARVAAWREAGFGRMSLGVQSFDDAYLARIGRDHQGTQAREAVLRAMGAGFVVNVDLIFAGPHYDAAVLAADLAEIGALSVDHVSAYQLTVEEGTAFWRRRERGELALPDDDATSDYFDAMTAGLAAAGLTRYEVSNYARTGRHSRHNTGYWIGSEYLGVGTGAHSLRIENGVAWRRGNARALKQYSNSPDASATIEELDPETHLRERLFLAARTRTGVPVEELEAQFGAPLLTRVRSELEDFVATGVLEEDPLTIRPTERGLDVCDLVAKRLFAPQ